MILLTKTEILTAVGTYAIPIYDPAFVTLFLETLLCQMRGQIIKFSKNLKRRETELEENLTTSIKTFKRKLTLAIIIALSKRILLEIYLCNWRIYVRKRLSAALSCPEPIIVDNWKKPSKFFLNLEKRNHVNKNIPSLKDKHENKVTDPQEILNLQRQFYQELFSSKETTPLIDSKYSEKLYNLPKISDS